MVVVELPLYLIRRQDHDDVRLAGNISHGAHLEPRSLRLGPALRAGIQAHDDAHAAVLQVEGMGVTLAAVANDTDRLVLQQRKVRILVVVHLNHAQGLPPSAIQHRDERFR